MTFVEELQWRGMVHNIMPGIDDHLSTGMKVGYAGFDPTADSLHIGNLVPIMMLVHLQKAGHKPIALVGGATGMIGDPSGKDKERQLLSEDILQYNVGCIKKQLEHFLDFELGENAAEMTNNYDWFKDFGFLGFLREVGKYITINYMKAKESVKARLSGESGISYTEFAYQLVQGYDFLHLYQEKNCTLQMGGSDQWGNITTGSYLIGKKMGSEAKAYAITCPLITREDGTKFGKSESGDKIWLSAERTSPYMFYQYWINVSDQDAEKFIKIFTLKTKEKIEALVAEHAKAPHQRMLHKVLAEDLTKRVHGEEGLNGALAITNFLFGRKQKRADFEKLTAKDWKEIVQQSSDAKAISKDKLNEGINILDFLVELGITKSRSEARRSVTKDKSVSLNGAKCQDIEQVVTLDDAFHNTYLQIQRGKKNKFIVYVE